MEVEITEGNPWWRRVRRLRIQEYRRDFGGYRDLFKRHPLKFFGSNKMKKSLLSAVALTAMVAFSGTAWADLLGQACAHPYHDFWPCDASLLDASSIDRTRVHGPRQVTDAYLLALATQHRGRFVTFDQSVPLSAVHGATTSNLATL